MGQCGLGMDQRSHPPRRLHLSLLLSWCQPSRRYLLGQNKKADKVEMAQRATMGDYEKIVTVACVKVLNLDSGRPFVLWGNVLSVELYLLLQLCDWGLLRQILKQNTSYALAQLPPPSISLFTPCKDERRHLYLKKDRQYSGRFSIF